MTRRRVRLVDIDRLIDERFMPKKCLQRGRSRCQCDHPSLSHERFGNGGYGRGGWIGACKCRGCRCREFKPYDYAKEQARQRDKLRAFAFDVLRLDTPKEE